MQYYDAEHNRLVYVHRKADEKFWDDQWQRLRGRVVYNRKRARFSQVVFETRKRLDPNSLILEGGAGLGKNSWYLHCIGYRTVALDYAPQAVAFMRSRIPEVTPVLGDVRNLQFADATFDGYWSFGVIEHFYDGYTEILKEMHRVIRARGFLFLTFPHMNWLRRQKSNRWMYPLWNPLEHNPETFYQFALDKDHVVRMFEDHGFMLRDTVPQAGLKGLKDEVSGFRAILQRLYDNPSLPAKVLNKGLDYILNGLTSHSVLLVLEKRSEVF